MIEEARQTIEEERRRRTMELTEDMMMARLQSKGYSVLPPGRGEPRRQTEVVRRPMSETAPQRPTSNREYQPEDIYQEGDYLKKQLHPRNWKALADPRVPWPKDVDPLAALRELAPFLAYRLNEEEARARGRSINDMIAPHEQV